MQNMGRSSVRSDGSRVGSMEESDAILDVNARSRATRISQAAG